MSINNNIADIAIRIKRYPVALEALEKNLRIHKNEAQKEEYTLHILGKYYAAKEDYPKAKNYYQQAI